MSRGWRTSRAVGRGQVALDWRGDLTLEPEGLDQLWDQGLEAKPVTAGCWAQTPTLPLAG